MTCTTNGLAKSAMTIATKNSVIGAGLATCAAGKAMVKQSAIVYKGGLGTTMVLVMKATCASGLVPRTGADGEAFSEGTQKNSTEIRIGSVVILRAQALLARISPSHIQTPQTLWATTPAIVAKTSAVVQSARR